MSLLSLYLLGAPRVEKDSQAVEFDTRKAVALLAYLAVSGQSHSRETLTSLLWPEYDTHRARAALRRTLSTMHTALGDGALRIEREQVGLEPGAWGCIDVSHFTRLLAERRAHPHPPSETCPACLPSLAQAAEVYRGDFLAGFTLRDSAAFDEWQLFHTEALRRELAGVLQTLSLGIARQGDFAAALQVCHRWLSLDPLREAAHRLLMQLYAWSGQRNAALRQYRECVRILDRELGVPPLEETTLLYTQIMENRLERLAASSRGEAFAPTEPGPGVRVAAPDAFPLVGRAADWQKLLEAYQATQADGRFVVLEGEAGIGKTRLAEEFSAALSQRGATCLAARCYPGETNLAYAPIIACLRSALSQPEAASRLQSLSQEQLAEVGRLLPELAHQRPGSAALPPLANPGAQTRFFESLSEALNVAAGVQPPGVLLLDDLHWADAASLNLLTYLARRLHGRRLFILCTWRDDLTPAAHPLQALTAEMQRLGLGMRLRLQRFDAAEVNELLVAARQSGLRLPDGVGKRLFQEAEGLPFFVVEYLKTLDEAAPTVDEKAWRLPSGVRNLLRSRMAGLDETAWQLLGAAAVIGRSFDFDSLSQASGREEAETLTALEALLARGIIREQPVTPSGKLAYDFDHEKLRLLVYEETSQTRRRLLHRRVAEALAGRGRNRPDEHSLAGQVAYHYQRGGEEARAAHFYQIAGEQAYAVYALDEALAHFQNALALGHPEAGMLHLRIGEIQTLLGEYQAALCSLEAAAALCQPDRLGEVEHKLAHVHHRRGEWELAELHFQAALEASGESASRALQAHIFSDWSQVSHQRGQSQAALQRAQRALDLATQAQDAQALAHCQNVLGILARHRQEYAQASQHLEESLAIARQLGDNGAQVAALNNLALVCGDSEQWSEAIDLTRQSLELCARLGDRHRQAALHNNLADLYHAAGDSEAAMAQLKKAVAIFAEIGVDAGQVQTEIWKLSEW